MEWEKEKHSDGHVSPVLNKFYSGREKKCVAYVVGQERKEIDSFYFSGYQPGLKIIWWMVTLNIRQQCPDKYFFLWKCICKCVTVEMHWLVFYNRNSLISILL